MEEEKNEMEVKPIKCLENIEEIYSEGKLNRFSFVNNEKGIIVKAPVPTYWSERELYSTQKLTKDEFFDGWEFLKDGSKRFTDKMLLKRERGIILVILKKLACCLITANFKGFSLPVQLNEDRSFTDRMGEFFRLAPEYLNKAADNNCPPEERIRLILAWNVGSVHCLIRKMKSFNPLWGETYSASLSDGTMIYVEQTSHHPPILHYLVVGKGYRCSGYQEIIFNIKLNKGYLDMKTKCKVDFRGHIFHTTMIPLLKMSGMITGARIVVLQGPITCWHPQSNTKGVVFFNYGRPGGYFKQLKEIPKNMLQAIVYISSKVAEPELLNNIRIASLLDVQTVISQGTGIWNSFFQFDQTQYWNIDTVREYNIILDPNPLPSDWRFREDIIWLRRNKLKYAQIWKEALEATQRIDRSNREKHLLKLLDSKTKHKINLNNTGNSVTGKGTQNDILKSALPQKDEDPFIYMGNVAESEEWDQS